MQIRRRCRFPDEVFRHAQQSSRGRIVVQPGNITDLGDSDAVGAKERPVVQEIPVDPEATLVHQRVMPGAQEQQVIDSGLAAVRPVLDVMALDETTVIVSREGASVVVSCPNGPLDRLRDDA